MQTVARRARRGKGPPSRPIPPVLEPEEAPDEAPLDAEVVPRAEAAAPAPAEAPRRGPRERDAEGREIDWADDGSLKKGNANLVMLWFIVPLVLVILWQLLFEGGGP